MSGTRTSDDRDVFASEVRGTFFRAVDPRFRASVIAGSRSAGRYSRPDEPTLYLSSSVAGVEAALVAHPDTRATEPVIVEVDVVAPRIVDLRDATARGAAGVDLEDATAPWQQVVADGGVPASWQVRDRLVALGADGLIDPSRKRPGLWHLVLFRWNTDGAPQVHVRTGTG
ncbi:MULTISPECIES: RES domain-containing protein [unclassified Curtobacterium]|uniref:RES family NAD+ phosphorylase n=1 Tax=unclassified Curtobacterium TaxID=257496 RepID=UPI0028818560|nr:RES domain-containing protein [Curtobacterium sp. BRD11]MDT0212153.1 RES domain-containing protein [Curtobacterium sp. BRD11]